MASSDPHMTTVSANGEITLPKAILEQRRWGAGTLLVVDDTTHGVILRAASVFAPTRPEDVFGSLRFAGTPKTLDEMDAGITAEARLRHRPSSDR